MSRLRLHFFNENLGPFTVTPDPIGLDDLDQTLKRSEENDGVTFEYTLDLEFAKGAKSYLQTVYNNEGIQGVVIVGIFEYNPNAFKWESIGEGKIKMTAWSLTAEKFKTNIEQRGFERKVLNLWDVDVDIETEISQGGVVIPATPIFNLELHAKRIIKSYQASPADGNEFAQLNATQSMEIDRCTTPLPCGTNYDAKMSISGVDFGNAKLTDLEAIIPGTYGFIYLPGEPIHGAAAGSDYVDYLGSAIGTGSDLGPQINIRPTENYLATEAGLADLKLRLKLKPSFYVTNSGGDVDICGSGALGHCEANAFFERRDKDGSILQITHLGTWTTAGCGGDNRIGSFETIEYQQLGVDVAVGEKWYVYVIYRVYGDYERPVGALDGILDHEFRIEADIDINEEDCLPNTFIKITSNTTFPNTFTKATPVYEFLNKLCQYVTDQEDCFRSDYFNRTDTVNPSDEDGAGSLVAITSGNCIRNASDPTAPGPCAEGDPAATPTQVKKTIIGNLKDAFSSLNAIHCLGFGFEREEGRQVIRIDPKSKFYNKNDLVLDLGVVSDLERRPAIKYYYNQVEAGFLKPDIQQVNAIDEFTTIRRYKLPITEVNNKLSIVSTYRASGYEIEFQRRLVGSTRDSRLDDSNFFINLIRDGGGFAAKRDEGFALIENLFDPASAFNLDYSTERTVRNWMVVLAANILKTESKTLTFTTGEYNYFIRTQKTGEPSPIAGNGDIYLGNTEPIWIPEIDNFNVGLTSAQMAQVRAKLYGYYIYREKVDGPRLEGYLLKCSRKASIKKANFDLLRVFRNV